MEANDYQSNTNKTAIYPGSKRELYDSRALYYLVMGLTGEAGEVANVVKKVARDKGDVFEYSDQDDLVDELGDVCWYVAQLANRIGVDLETILHHNVNKLRARYLSAVPQEKTDGTTHG